MSYIYGSFSKEWQTGRVKKIFWWSAILLVWTLIVVLIYFSYYVGYTGR